MEEMKVFLDGIIQHDMELTVHNQRNYLVGKGKGKGAKLFETLASKVKMHSFSPP